MIRVINKKRYNTDTAEELGHYTNGRGCSDFHAVSERLYRTKKGAFFLYYWGGAASKYSEAHGGGYCEGDGIRPMSAEDALSWLEENGCTESIDKYFDDCITDA